METNVRINWILYAYEHNPLVFRLRAFHFGFRKSSFSLKKALNLKAK